MLFGISASNREGRRFFAVVAKDKEQAKSFVKEELGRGYKVQAEELEELLSSQYPLLAELSAT